MLVAYNSKLQSKCFMACMYSEALFEYYVSGTGTGSIESTKPYKSYGTT